MREGVKVLNPPESVANAVNKVKAFRLWSKLDVLNVPMFYEGEAPESFEGILLARTDVSASSGRGIVVCRPGDTVPAAPLYVTYIPKLVEYRLHVVDNKVIFAQQKKRSSNAEQDKDQKLIRSYDNGWVFCPIDLKDVDEDVKNAGVMAVNGLGLHFGAIDIVIHRDNNKPYILECNTAPGISSPTLLAAYKEAFEAWLN